MDGKEDPKVQKQGIPEALHPGIGNGSAWETDPHFLALRVVDPLATLDSLLLDDAERSSILEKWNTISEEGPSLPEALAESDILPTSEIVYSSKKIAEKDQKKRKKHKNTRDISAAPDWIDPEHLILKEDPNKQSETGESQADEELPMEPEGKRVKKALKRVRKEEEKSKSIVKPVQSPPFDSGLSPFTSWLKGLRGSEYVHPYEDDYGLGQMRDPDEAGISETFADLLVAQGFRAKAIEMYMLLMAKYPEKSSFFAAKIEALK